MTELTNTPASPRLAEVIAIAAAAAKLPKSERMKQHRKCLRSIAFYQGIEGAAAYKAEHPEAASIRVDLNAIAYSPKPKGYGTYLASLAERWLSNEVALHASNAADVAQLNERFGSTFPPGKHFSEPLSNGRLALIKAVFRRQSLPFDIKKTNTMSKVRSAAKAFNVLLNPERRLGVLGTVTGTTLAINRQPFPIEQNGDRECIRVTIDGKRRRLYLADMEWLSNLLIGDRVDPLYTTVRSIGELAYSGSEPDLSAGEASGITEPACTEISDQPECLPHSTASDGYLDPLQLDWDLTTA